MLPVALMAKVISGQVCGTEGEVVSFANVVLYQKQDSIHLSSTTTNTDGYFEINVKDIEQCFLQVSHVGYQTQNVAINDSILKIVLMPTLLSEVIVTADMIKKDASSEVYYITDSLRKSSANTLQLLDKLKGIKIDWTTDAVKIGEYRDVPIMVESKEMSLEYVRNLNPERIRRVEILRFPKGKYGSAPIVINIKLNNSYAGFDLGLRAKGMVSLRNKHSHSTDDGITFTYATGKWNIYGDAGVKNKRFFEARSYEETYSGQTEVTATEDYKNPNSRNRLTNINFSVGADYKINRNHVVSFQTWIDNNKEKDKQTYNDGMGAILSQTVGNYNASNITVGAFYRGVVGQKLHLSSDVTYNYYDVDEDKNFILYANTSDQLYEGKKNYGRVNADARYVWNDVLSSTIGYTFTKKDYNNYDRQSNAQLFSSEESRHDAYFSMNVTPAKNFNFVVGSNFLNVEEKNDDLSDANFSWMPLAKVYWKPFKFVSFLMNYFCDVQHPNLDKLSTVAYQRNAFLWYKGNAELKAQIMHYMQCRINLRDWIEFTYLYKYSSHEFTPWYYADGNRVIETLTNGDYVHQYLGLNGDYALPLNLGINFTANYQWYKRRSDEQMAWRNGHTWYLDVTATWRVYKGITLMSGYFLRYDKEPLLQGEKYGQNEQLMLGANVSALNNKLSLMLAMTIPTNAISKRTYSEISIPDYHYIAWNDEQVNNTMVQLSIRYNIGKGKVSKWQNKNNSEKEK